MPNRKEHEDRSFQRYGVRGGDIHAFLDEPVSMKGGKHRQFRHDTETVRLVGQLFGAKYTLEVAENIALDHIMLDHQEEIEREHQHKTHALHETALFKEASPTLVKLNLKVVKTPELMKPPKTETPTELTDSILKKLERLPNETDDQFKVRTAKHYLTTIQDEVHSARALLRGTR